MASDPENVGNGMEREGQACGWQRPLRDGDVCPECWELLDACECLDQPDDWDDLT